VGTRWRIGLQADPVTVHSWFVFTALAELEAAGEVELRLLDRALPAERAMWLEVGGISVCIDLTDRAALAAPLRSASADVTWKRSFDPVGYPGDVRPFGPLLGCRSGRERHRPDYARHLGVRRALASWRDRPPLLSAHEAPVDRGDRRVLFQVRAWEPDAGDDPGDRAARNEDRATLIRTLRRELGDRVRAGFTPSPYARAAHPDCLVAEEGDYLAVVQSCRIGVSTTGLHGSIPYKVGEYLAASRAIVAERFLHSLPAPLTGVDVFDRPEDCVAACVALLEDDALLDERQQWSARYWRDHARPDVLLRRCLVDLGGR
jgi:hypothetical protein